MRITCPSCTLTYQISRDSLGETGRNVRCTDCRTVWFVTPSVDVAPPAPIVDVDLDGYEPPPPVEEGDIIAVDPQAEGFVVPVVPVPVTSAIPAPQSIESIAAKRYKTAKKPAPRSNGWFGIDPGLVLAGLLIAAIGAALLMRVPIVRAVPHVASLYARIGLPVNLRGIDIHDVVTRTEYEDGQPVVIVEGRIQNASNGTIQVPQLRFAARSMTGSEIYSWVLSPGRPMLGIRESVAFRTKFPNPPKDALDVEVRFVRDQGRGKKLSGAKS